MMDSNVYLFFREIFEAYAKGERVEIRGLCSLSAKENNSYQCRNPRCGEIVHESN